ncbi:type II toxin-antitoxin system RelE/ParE family toxin [Methylosinus sporium]|uniref:Type II toxin-antitoxin system RelE/ParE family toxin n=1 Tax=Methylosinus sporium TaxID=428 RepID=A0A549SW56_METSR|nr:type II toxin-antitoxin system RelE/ParE family toxin [Methylosinus sporium]MBU3888468.1 type II toxin-antitoxin system RelE/ParE family toxin [Methylosinus sp. KRF6]TRL33872.1 type II toxin-antitoxin system RelE/ParE family toxin [Methylosinus sporium]
MAKLHYTRRAREDLIDIWLYIAPRNSDALADAIYDRIEESCARLAQHPQLGRTRPEIAPDARALVVERWLALYRLTDYGAQIVRIVDGARDLAAIEWPPE